MDLEQGAAGSDALSRMIARLRTQQACIDVAVQRIANLPGFVLEVGLGKGRTFDRLRHCLPGRSIFAFDRFVHCPEALRPADDQLFLGDFLETLPRAYERLGRGAALVHADVGSEDLERDRRLTRELAPLLTSFLLPGGILMADRAMGAPGLLPLAVPPAAARWHWPYFLWSMGPGHAG